MFFDVFVTIDDIGICPASATTGGVVAGIELAAVLEVSIVIDVSIFARADRFIVGDFAIEVIRFDIVGQAFQFVFVIDAVLVFGAQASI